LFLILFPEALDNQQRIIADLMFLPISSRLKLIETSGHHEN
jgi:hypothetical protein